MFHPRLFSLMFVLSAAAAAVAAAQVTPALELGHVIEDSLAPNESRKYNLDLRANQVVRVEILRRDVDMTLEIVTPDGVHIGQPGLSRLCWLIRIAGRYQVRIQGPPTQKKSVRYAVVMSELRSSIGSDDPEALAQQKLLQGHKLEGGSAEERQQAVAAYEEAQRLSHDSGDIKGEGDALLLKSDILFNFGDTNNALAAAEQAQQIAHRAGDSWLEAEGLANVVRIRTQQQRYDESLDGGERAIKLYRTVGDRMGEHVVLENLARVYGEFGEYATAIELLKRVLDFAEAIGNQEGQVYTLSGLGTANRELGHLRTALDCKRRAIEVARTARLTRVEGFFLADLGIIQEELGQLDSALESFQSSLAFSKRVGSTLGEARARHLIGALYERQGNHAEAREWVEASLPGLRAGEKTGDEAGALADLARIDRSEGNLEMAQTHIEAALDLYEAARNRIPTEELRSTFVAKRYTDYEFAVALVMERHKAEPTKGLDSLAFGTSERARARGLLDLLAHGSRGLNADVDAKLLEHQQALEADLKKASEQQLSLLAREHTKEEAIQADAEVNRLSRAVRDARAETRASNNRLSSIAFSQTITIAEVQELLDDDDALLEYFLGERRGFVWLVTRSASRVIDLPSRSELDRLARDAYKDLSVTTGGNSRAVMRLSRILLAPVERDLPKRIFVVPDSGLHYIPFGALRLSSGKLLLAQHTVAYVPSASTLRYLRRAQPTREHATQLAAVLADPVYSDQDSRVPPRFRRSRERIAAAHQEVVTRSAKEVGLLRFDRLYASRSEAMIIHKLALNEPIFEALDFDASRETAMGADVGQARIIHFAVHGLLNPKHPELSGLVLSLVDNQGRPRDGFLSVRDIFDLHLRSDLVVLSACETALGADVRGEGLVGLTHAFFFTGAQSIVASLWRVPDAATAALMQKFYRYLLIEKLPAAEALRASQVSLMKQARWARPYYWAGFVVQGESRQSSRNAD